ncbi:MAG: cyclase family protein [Pseudomonadota bacterium]
MSTEWPKSIARRLDFQGAQSNYFGVPAASAEPMRGGDFVGDTNQGGSCNADVITMNPHCHGTHTEGIGHVVSERVDVYDILPLHPVSAILVTLADVPASETTDRCPPSMRNEDRILTQSALESAVSPEQLSEFDALIIRTLPNDEAKAHRHYTDSTDYPYFSHTAMRMIVDAGIAHLLIDTPSLDRLDDGGDLAVHRQFWRLPRRGHETTASSRLSASITEMIFVPSDIPDGAWRVMLQPTPFSGDAVPSNPILLPRQGSV